MNMLPLRDPNAFVAGQLHTCLAALENKLNNSISESAMVRKWILEGIDVHDFLPHLKVILKVNPKTAIKEFWLLWQLIVSIEL